jgi:hypothetical protein
MARADAVGRLSCGGGDASQYLDRFAMLVRGGVLVELRRHGKFVIAPPPRDAGRSATVTTVDDLPSLVATGTVPRCELAHLSSNMDSATAALELGVQPIVLGHAGPAPRGAIVVADVAALRRLLSGQGGPVRALSTYHEV